jgi:hypothetical protein
MDTDFAQIDRIASALEAKGEVSMMAGSEELFIQSIDDKEGYVYVSSTNREFRDSREAAEWAIEKMNSLRNLEGNQPLKK